MLSSLAINQENKSPTIYGQCLQPDHLHFSGKECPISNSSDFSISNESQYTSCVLPFWAK